MSQAKDLLPRPQKNERQELYLFETHMADNRGAGFSTESMRRLSSPKSSARAWLHASFELNRT
jgi:hypothetical protein